MSKPLDDLLLETLGKPSPGPDVPMQNLFKGPEGYQLTHLGAYERALAAHKRAEISVFSVGRVLVKFRKAYQQARAIDAESPITKELAQGLDLARKFGRIAYNKP